jgi:hypothetical protein
LSGSVVVLPITNAQFRADRPEFSDIGVYLDSDVNQLLTIANNTLPADRWGDWIVRGIEMFVSHHLVLMNQAERTGAAGGLPGMPSGVLTSKSVGPASASYDVHFGSESDDSGHWNLTIYGRQFIRMARMVGIGGWQATGWDQWVGVAAGSSLIWQR